MINIIKYFQFFSNSIRYLTFHAFCVFSACIQVHSTYLSIYKQIPSTYSQYTNKFIPRSQQICRARFCRKIFLILRVLRICTDTLRGFSVYIIILSCLLSTSKDWLRIFCKSAQIISNIQNEIIFFTAFKRTLLKKTFKSVQLDVRHTGNNWLFWLTTKISSDYSDNTWNDLLIWMSWPIQIYIRK